MAWSSNAPLQSTSIGQMSNGIGLIVAVGAFLLVGAYLMMNQASLDIAGPLRNWLWARDAQKMRAKGVYPETIERSYWTKSEYARDVARMQELGYTVTSEQTNEPYVTGPVDPRSVRPPTRRRIPIFHVIYERGHPVHDT